VTQEEFLAAVVGFLDQAGIPFMVAGSFSSSYHGQPRATHDVDLVIDPSLEQLDRLLTLIGERFYVSAESAREALQRRSMFNLIDFDEGWKADLIIRKDRPFSREEFQRRQSGTLLGRSLPIASAEDVILSKLEWDKITPSERHLPDALHVALVQWPRLDKEYLRKWAPHLGVADKLDALLRQAEELRGEQQPPT